jgi:hypothetical protein
MDESASGSLLMRVVAWVIVIAVGVIALKLIVAALFGFVQVLFSLVLLVLVVMGVLWAFRHL